MPFNRYLSEFGMQLLEEKPQWWQDLLDYRFLVNGNPRPLLLAIRNGSLNAYVEGQSVLKIAFKDGAKAATLKAEIHSKYLDSNAIGGEYLKFNGHSIGENVYEGRVTFDAWAEKARGHVRHPRSPDKLTEKEGVAAIAYNNSNVIDVEMGQNVTGDRIDIVALERDGVELSIVFYEAKLQSNTQALRAKDYNPKVVDQLQRYRDWLAESGRKEEVCKAYRQSCDYLVRLNATRNQEHHVDDLIKDAAKPDSRLKVDLEPRLIIFGPLGQMKTDAWAPHERALRKAGVKLIIEESPENVTLPKSTPGEDHWR